MKKNPIPLAGIGTRMKNESGKVPTCMLATLTHGRHLTASTAPII